MRSEWRHGHAVWVVVLVMGLHMLEEFALDVNSWAERIVPFHLLPGEFYMVNLAYLTFAIGSAVVGWRMPGIALMTPATCVINAVFMHILGSLYCDCYSPGLL